MPRFAILWHELPDNHARSSHWDLLLEDGLRLRTWALPHEPVIGLRARAEQLPDHRLVYLDYQGPVSGGRGHVAAWDRGELCWLDRSDERIEVQLSGQRLRANVRLTRDAVDQGWWIEISEADCAT